MSKNYVGKMSIDVSPFKNELKSLSSAIKIAKNNLKEVQATSINWKNSTVDLSNVLKAQSNIVKLAQEKLDVLNKEYDELIKSGKGTEASTRKLNEQISTQKKELALAQASLKTYETEALESAKNNLNLSESFNSLKMVIAQLGVELAKKAAGALVDFTKETVNAGLQFETAFAGVKKVVDGTEEDFAKLQNEIRKTAIEKPISADTLASLYQMGAQLGIDKNNLKDFTATIIDLKNTSDLTEEAGAEMIAQYANVMKLPYKDYRRFGSTLSYLGSTTATTESRIMELAQRMSGSASIIGMTNQGVLALATSMGSVGLNAEMGGSAISAIMLNIEEAVAKNNNKLKVWADTAKMSTSEFSKLWKSDVASAMQAVIKGLSDEKAGGESLVLTLEELGIKNIRQKSTMLQLASASDLFIDTLKKANEEWDRNTFLTDSANKVYMTTANQMSLLQNSFKEVQLSIYDDLSKPLQEVTKELTDFLKSDDVKAFSENFATALANLGKGASLVIKSLIKNFDKVLVVAKLIATTIATMITTTVVAGITTKIVNIVSAFKKLATVIKATEGAQKALNITMNANTIGLVITGIGILVGAILDLNVVLNSTKGSMSEIQKQILENNATRDKEIAGIESEYNHYQSLVDELKTLVDENGNVKKGYEDRVNAIIPLLQNATGEEITLIGNQIQGYDRLISKLDEVIAKKRAEAKMSAYEDDYKEALKNEEELAEKKKALEDRIKRDKEKDDGSLGLRADSTGVTAARNDLRIAEAELADINAQLKNGTEIIEKYEGMLKDYTETYTKSINKVESGINGEIANTSGTSVGSNKNQSAAVKESKTKEKTENELLKEGNYTYAELTELNKKYKNDLKIYAEEMKKGNSAITVAMVEETKKNLDTVEKKLKDMKDILGTTPTNILSTENDTTEEQLENKKKILKDTLSKLGTEMKNGNAAITNEMLDQINKAIDQTDAKLQSLKNKYDEVDEDEEISEEINTGEAEGLHSNGVIYGKGVLDKEAIYDNAAKQAQIEAEAQRQAELAIQEENLLANANQDALNKQVATLDPSNLEIYDTTERMLAESEQTSHAAGLNDNAYKVVNAEINTLNQAKQAALSIDFTVIGQYICQGIVNGINANKYMVIEAVRSMMEEANEACEDEEEIGSPSKVFYKYGKFIDMGLANGIRDYASEASKQIKGMALNLQSGISEMNSVFRSKNGENYASFEGSGKTENNYYFTQNNTSTKALDTLSIYKESKSLLKRAVRDQYV